MKDFFSKHGILKKALSTKQSAMLECCFLDAKVGETDSFEMFKVKYLEEISILKKAVEALSDDFLNIIARAEKILNQAVPSAENSLLSAFGTAKKNSLESYEKDRLTLEISEIISLLAKLSADGAVLLSNSYSGFDVEYKLRKAVLEEFELLQNDDFFFSVSLPRRTIEDEKAKITKTLQNAETVSSALSNLFAFFESADTVIYNNAVRECMRLVHNFTFKAPQKENL